MMSRNFIELQNGIELYYPLGISAFGAATAIVLASPEARRAARKSARVARWLGVVSTGLLLALARILGAGVLAVPLDLAAFTILNVVAVRRARQFGKSLPDSLARQLCAETIGPTIPELVFQSWVVLAMSVVFMMMFFCAWNAPALGTLGVSAVMYSVYNVLQWHKLAGAYAQSQATLTVAKHG